MAGEVVEREKYMVDELNGGINEQINIHAPNSNG